MLGEASKDVTTLQKKMAALVLIIMRGRAHFMPILGNRNGSEKIWQTLYIEDL